MMGMPFLRFVPSKWRLTAKVLPFVALILSLKFLANRYGVEFLTMSPLMGAIISANVFLIGFLVSGVLGDYKESERLPGELACCLEAMADEGSIVLANTKSPKAKAFIDDLDCLINLLFAWFDKKERTGTVFRALSHLNTHFLAFEPLTQANFIVRMKQEQSAIRRIITRIHTIRETSFNQAGYAIAEIISVILCVGLIFTHISPYHESVFFVAFISFLLIYMVFFVKDLDNPFEYYADAPVVDNIPLKPLMEIQARLKDVVQG